MAASRRTGSSLYARSHGFGSGKKQWNVSYVCRSFQEPHQTLEAGDKIILPEAAFREVSRMKLPFPLLLRVVNSRLKNRRTDTGRAAKPGRPGGKPAGRPGAKAAGKPAQADGGKPAAKAPPVTEMYCGVIEFSAPAGEVMMPKWMMRSLHIREGGKADFTSIVKLPRGEWCVFRPHQEAFVQVIHDLGPRIFMETAMRNYSALSKGGTIVIDHFGETFKLDVVDTKPADSISLYGDCDLEVDFLPAKDSAAAAAGPSGAGQVVSGAPVPEAIDNTPIAQNLVVARFLAMVVVMIMIVIVMVALAAAHVALGSMVVVVMTVVVLMIVIMVVLMIVIVIMIVMVMPFGSMMVVAMVVAMVMIMVMIMTVMVVALGSMLDFEVNATIRGSSSCSMIMIWFVSLAEKNGISHVNLAAGGNAIVHGVVEIGRIDDREDLVNMDQVL
eukprot:g3790.t1